MKSKKDGFYKKTVQYRGYSSKNIDHGIDDPYPQVTNLHPFDKIYIEKIYNNKEQTGKGLTKVGVLGLLKAFNQHSQNLQFVTSKMRINHWCRKRTLKNLNIRHVWQLCGYLKQEQEDPRNDKFGEYVNSFVALGGGPEREGVVLRQKIIELVNTFELTIEIEDYLEAVGIEDEYLSFKDFCKIFDEPQNVSSKFYNTYCSFKSCLTAQGTRKPMQKRQRQRQGPKVIEFNPQHKDFIRFLEEQGESDLI